MEGKGIGGDASGEERELLTLLEACCSTLVEVSD
jgi:hypothetical protein